MTETVKIGVIGGSGLYNMPEISDKQRITIDTPYGKPSDEIVIGTLAGKRVAFIPRHGEGHVHTPTTVPYRANIYALKTLGVRFCIAVNACGSLREEVAPGHLVIPDQLYDNTRSERGGRTFFESGLVGHVSVADPLCPELSKIILKAVSEVNGIVLHEGGVFIIIEGPRFSTRGESHAYRQLGFKIIGMTSCPEAFLAREAEIAYSTIAHVTDYDVWREETEAVTTDIVLNTIKSNVEKVQRALINVIEQIDESADFHSHHALTGALMTAKNKIPPELIKKLAPLLKDRFA